jgi:plasmid stabilization system protein ParE
MDFQVLIADSALTDLQGIVEFVARDDRDAAIRLGDKLVDCALSLRAMSERFPFHDKVRGIRKMPISPFLIFYLCDQKAATVTILHFWHGARRSPAFYN